MKLNPVISWNFNIFFLNIQLNRDNEVNEKWLTNLDQLRDAINRGISSAIEATSTCEQQLCDKLKTIKASAIEKEIKKALGK